MSRSNTTSATFMPKPAVNGNGTNSIPAQIDGARRNSNPTMMTSSSGLIVEEFPDLAAVPSQSSKTDDSKKSTSALWSTPREASGIPFATVTPSTKPTITNPNSQRDCVGGVPSQFSTADISRRTTSSLVANVEPSGRPSTSFPRVTASFGMASQMAGKDVVSPPNLTADGSNNTSSSAWSTRLTASERPSTPVPFQAAGEGDSTQSSSKTSSAVPGRPSTPVPPMARPIPVTPQIHGKAVPPINTGAVPSSGSFNDPRKIPKGVFVVCDDFLFKNLKRAASIYEKSKACKGCENRSRLKYAVWSDNSKQWQLIRPYPADKVPAKVAFKECAHYSTNKTCVKTPCAFAHGQQELIMWTMEREGSKFDKTPFLQIIELEGNRLR